MTTPIRLPREDGAWYMALMCWLAGWAAAARPAWEPLVVAVAVVALLAAAQQLRTARRLWIDDPRAARRAMALFPALMLPPTACLVLFLGRVTDDIWLVAILVPALFYAPIVVAGQERLPVSRALAVGALTAIAPATYGLTTGRFGATAALLWAALGGYFLLGAMLVIARLRRGVRWPVYIVRLAAPGAAVLFATWSTAHWVLALPFAILAIRAWSAGAPDAPPDPRRIGRREIAFSAAASALVIVGLWLR